MHFRVLCARASGIAECIAVSAKQESRKSSPKALLFGIFLFPPSHMMVGRSVCGLSVCPWGKVIDLPRGRNARQMRAAKSTSPSVGIRQLTPLFLGGSALRLYRCKQHYRLLAHFRHLCRHSSFQVSCIMSSAQFPKEKDCIFPNNRTP